MSKKETRRAARQAFPKAPARPDRSKTYGQRPAKRTRSSQSSSVGRQKLRPPSLRRAAIQGAILVVLYLILIRFVWQEPGTSVLAYVIMAVAGFVIYTGIAYGIDKFTYQRRLRKLSGSPKK